MLNPDNMSRRTRSRYERLLEKDAFERRVREKYDELRARGLNYMDARIETARALSISSDTVLDILADRPRS